MNNIAIIHFANGKHSFLAIPMGCFDT